MISIKRHLEQPANLVCAVTSAYQSALLAICQAAARTAPNLGPNLSGNITLLEGKPGTREIAEMDRKVVAELDRWGERASDYFRQKTAEVKEILLLVTRSAQAAGEKDEKYVSQLGAFAGRLSNIANLEDISSIRKSLSESASELMNCIDHLALDSKQLVSKLQSEVTVYQTRLAEAERHASLDLLTGLENRRGIERKLEDRMKLGKPFCVVFFDLNGFKQINDRHGHIAGDELLKNFAAELRGRFRPVDSAGRWGGDEFIVLFDGPEDQAQIAVRKAAEWLFGEYRLKSVKVMLTAAIGVAEWNRKETAPDLLKRADGNMYLQKHARAS
jgi:diguanylate cyclase (GGDEF)-like protein